MEVEIVPANPVVKESKEEERSFWIKR